jgi:hypothetical protein
MKEWLIGKEVKRWILSEEEIVVDVVVVVGAVGAVNAGAPKGSAGAVNAVAVAVTGGVAAVR